MLLTNGINAEEDKYEICFVNGYFSGADDKFMMGLATEVTIKENVFLDPMCTAAHQLAYKVGDKFSSTGKYDSEQELKIIMYASEFRSKVNKAIIKLIEE